jgi:hypothetical protein
MAPTRTAPDASAMAAVAARFGPLLRGERLLLEACRYGEIARIGLRRPDGQDEDVTIRARVLAFVLRGGVPLKQRRLQLMGAAIEGRLDLGGTSIGGSLWFYRCRFDSPLLLDGAHVAGSVTFAGCRLPRLLAEGSRIDGDLALNAGCVVTEELHLRRARIGGDLDGTRLDLRGGSADGPLRRALMADGLQVGGDVRLTDHVQAVGEVRFVGARVAGDFRAGGHFTGQELPGGGRGVALRLDRLEVAGSLRLGEEFGAAGRTSLRRARIGGDLDASGASFDRLGDAAWSTGAALVLDQARVDGALVLRQLQAPLLGASFVDARVGTLADDATTWGERLVLDGFAYDRLDEQAPLDTVFRIDWLERQDPAHLRAQFRVQPWRRLIRVLRRMGHDRHAASIALRREQQLRLAGRIGAWAPAGLRWLPRAGHWTLGLLSGYGHRPERLLLWAAGVWLACSAIYWAATSGAGTALPTDDAVPLGALAFSLDRLLPLVEFDAARRWVPAADWAAVVRWLGRAEAGFGWLAALLLLGSVAGWIDRDRRR